MANLFRITVCQILSESAKITRRYDKNISAYFFLEHGVDEIVQ